MTWFVLPNKSMLCRTANNGRKRRYGFRQHLQRFWRPLLPVGVGLLLLAVLQWRHIRRKEHSADSKAVVVAKDWEITCYRAIPLRVLSRVWGWLLSKQLPPLIRPLVYNYYASACNCNLEEAAHDDLKVYKSLAEFFCRPLKDGVRPVNKVDCIVSPADGRVISFGPVKTCKVEQVKGVTYSLQGFLGEPTWDSRLSNTCTDHVNHDAVASSPPDYRQSLLLNKDTSLYQCVVYLAPGDYHRFHSPVQWDVTFRRHFQGELLSVNPKIARLIPDLFTLNERAVYVGRWKYGFFSLTAIGATNVGSIHVYCDKELTTNQWKWKWRKMESRHQDSFLQGLQEEKIHMCKGQPFGEFRLGSTIVLLFEAPKNFKFHSYSTTGAYGYSLLASGATALEVVTDATAVLEDSPLTNAGYGSNLTWDGNVECDASVMDGSTLHFGAVGAVCGVKNPVKLAENICKKQSCNVLALGRIPPCLLVGNGAHKWAEQAGLTTVHSKSLVSDKALKLYRHYKKKVARYQLQIDKVLTPLDTVGAVCVDAHGNLAAACSSGGVALKHPGRVGQAAMYGCGCWATNGTDRIPAIAACTSGCGEYLVRTMLAREAAVEVQKSECPVTALHSAMKTKFLESPFLRGVEDRLGGVILLKCIPSEGRGEFLWTHSSKTMCVSYKSDAERRPKTRVSELPIGAVSGSSLVVEGVTFKLHSSVERDDIGVRL